MSSAASTSDPKTRGHRGLIAVLIVFGVALALWCATVALVRQSAKNRVADELARMRAAGEPMKFADVAGPLPAPADDAQALLAPAQNEIRNAGGNARPGSNSIATAIAEDAELHDALARAGAADPSSAARLANRILLFQPMNETVDDTCMRLVFAAWARASRAEIETCRAAAARSANTFASGNRKDSTLTFAAVTVLLRSAVAAGQAGDGVLARAELERALALGVRIESAPLLITFGLHGMVLDVLSTPLARLSATDVACELRELDAVLAAIDVESDMRRALRGERALSVESIASGARIYMTSGWRRLLEAPPFGWPSREIARADGLELWRIGEGLVDVPLERVTAEPAFHEYGAALLRAQGASLTTGMHVHSALAMAVKARSRITLARAALRAMCDGAAAADAFLATQVDPFAGAPYASRREDDGTWSATGRGSWQARAVSGAPLPEPLVVRVRARR